MQWKSIVSSFAKDVRQNKDGCQAKVSLQVRGQLITLFWKQGTGKGGKTGQ